ncbi:hypothetical protein PybrP1_001098 [[Pythium] brassicae (nom. inval.)]|nr:hypothetical protein PybrP1_001098 [[Pythium] brassicae (nom. inval.)]
MSALTLERLGGGAAFLLRDAVTGTALLLGCGEARAALADKATGAAGSLSADDGSGSESVDDRDAYAHALRAVAGDAALVAVLVADARPAASFLLPFLTEKCALNAPVLLTHGTRALAPHRLAEHWATERDGALLFDEADIFAAFRKTTPVALQACTAVSEHVKVTAFHAGHVAGGCAFHIELGATTLVFAPDFNLRGTRVLLPAQLPRLEPTVLVTRSAFAVTVSETRTSMERELLRVVHECVSAGGKVVVPVHRLGFFHELLTILLDYWRAMQLACPICVSDVPGMPFPSRFAPLVARTFTDEFAALLAQRAANPKQHPEVLGFDWKRLQTPGPFVLFTAPASAAHGDSLRALKAVASDPKNLVVLSEHCTPGTVNYSLYADPQRRDAAKRLGVAVACGVHYFPCGDEVDAKSIVELVARVAPRHVLLDAGVPEDLHFVRTHVLNRLATAAGTGAMTTVRGLAHDGVTAVDGAREIPLKIHKSMFNNPFDVHGMLIAENKRKLLLVTAGNGARRLKKKRHALSFAFSWKKEPEPSTRVRTKSARAPSSALAFLLSGPAESADDSDEPEAQPQASVAELLAALRAGLARWLLDTPIEETGNRWLKIRSIGVSVSPEWEVHMEWAYEDEELAGRVLGIAKQVVSAEYRKMRD